LSAVAALLCAAVCALTLSRWGIAAGAGGMLLLVLMLRLSPSDGFDARRRPSRLLVGGAVACFVIAGALIAGLDVVRREYATQDWSKLQAIAGFVRSIGHHPVLGAGLGGGHAAVSTAGLVPGDLTFLWAESWPVDVAVGVGPLAAAIVIALTLAWLFRARRASRSGSPILIAGFCALVALGVHDLLDYSLWLGANAYLAAALAGVLATESTRAATSPRDEETRFRSLPAFCVAVALSALAGFVTARSTLTQDRDRAQAALQSASNANALRPMVIRHPADPYLPMVAASVAVRTHDRRSLRFVNRALQLAPNWYEPHFVLARVLIAHQLRSQAILELREAARLDGASELSGTTHAAIAETFIALSPSPDELERVIPSGSTGIGFLRSISIRSQSQPIGEAADRLLLERQPGDPDALEHEAGRAHDQHDFAREREILTRIASAHPERSLPAIRLSELDEANGDIAGAENDLRRGLAHAEQTYRLYSALAALQTRRRDTAGMRRTVQQWLDSLGGNIDARVQVLGELGQRELSLGNDAAALVAFERADSIAYPAHPFLPHVVRIAARAGDVPRLREACNALSDAGELTPELRSLCAPAMGTTATTAAQR
jgi:hypothetical protein